MKKIVTIIILLAVVIVVFLFLLSLPNKKLDISKVCFEQSSTCFRVEVAETPQTREQGLMFRNHLDKDKGMLFVFEREGSHPFWMKNTFIPLDMIWINKNQEVVFIKENAEPCREADCPMIDPQKNAEYVLEINGGLAHELNIKTGDAVTFQNQ